MEITDLPLVHLPQVTAVMDREMLPVATDNQEVTASMVHLKEDRQLGTILGGSRLPLPLPALPLALILSSTNGSLQSTRIDQEPSAPQSCNKLLSTAIGLLSILTQSNY